MSRPTSRGRPAAGREAQYMHCSSRSNAQHFPAILLVCSLSLVISCCCAVLLCCLSWIPLRCQFASGGVGCGFLHFPSRFINRHRQASHKQAICGRIQDGTLAVSAQAGVSREIPRCTSTPSSHSPTHLREYFGRLALHLRQHAKDYQPL